MTTKQFTSIEIELNQRSHSNEGGKWLSAHSFLTFEGVERAVRFLKASHQVVSLKVQKEGFRITALVIGGQGLEGVRKGLLGGDGDRFAEIEIKKLRFYTNSVQLGKDILRIDFEREFVEEGKFFGRRRAHCPEISWNFLELGFCLLLFFQKFLCFSIL